MKLLVSILIALAIYCTGYSQTKIELKDISSHIGDSVEVQGTIFGIRYFENAKNAPILINVGAAYPNQLLTIVVFDDVRKQFKLSLDEKSAKGNIAWVTGKVELYKGKPQIVITTPEQLDILIDTYIKKDQ